MLAVRARFSRLAILFAISLLPAVLFSQYTTATLSGIVTDSDGRTVPGAKVTIEDTGTGFVRAYITMEDGSYILPALPVGTYRLKIEKAGFSD